MPGAVEESCRPPRPARAGSPAPQQGLRSESRCEGRLARYAANSRSRRLHCCLPGHGAQPLRPAPAGARVWPQPNADLRSPRCDSSARARDQPGSASRTPAPGLLLVASASARRPPRRFPQAHSRSHREQRPEHCESKHDQQRQDPEQLDARLARLRGPGGRTLGGRRGRVLLAAPSGEPRADARLTFPSRADQGCAEVHTGERQLAP